MHKPDTDNFKFDQRSIKRIEQGILNIKALYNETLIEVSVFGSYAKGTHKKFSSIDFLVVIKSSNERFIRRNAELDKLLNVDSTIPLIEPLVYTEEELLGMIKKKESFIISMLNESVVVWNDLQNINVKNISSSNKIPSRYKASLPHLHVIKH